MTFLCESIVSNKIRFKFHMGIYVYIWLILSTFFIKNAHAWDGDELELFDLVEEINKNFYELLGIAKDADNKEVKKAFRKLSLVLHPDKNDSPDADVQFRQLVAVYEVLLDEQKRARYNDVLENGLPDWKHAVYYYRRVRKMGLLEMAIILFCIVTVGQYIVLWAAYAEKKYTAEQFVTSKIKKIQKKQKKGKADPAEIMLSEFEMEYPKPSVYDLLPFQTVRGFWLVVTGAPQCYRMIQALLAERRRQKEEEAEESSEESAKEDDDEKREKRVRRRKAFLPPELSNDDNETCILDSPDDRDADVPSPVPRKLIIGGLWTDDDFAELARLIKKFPGGTSERWEKIADAMNRTVSEVTHMARKLKEEHYRPTAGANEEAPVDVALKPSKIKTKGGKLARGVDDGGTERDDEGLNEEQPQIVDIWSQPQQKALENAMTKHPKGTSERWVKIANCVPGKNMEECIMRYKQLVEIIKKKKQTSQQPEEQIQARDHSETPIS